MAWPVWSRTGAAMLTNAARGETVGDLVAARRDLGENSSRRRASVLSTGSGTRAKSSAIRSASVKAEDHTPPEEARHRSIRAPRRIDINVVPRRVHLPHDQNRVVRHDGQMRRTG